VLALRDRPPGILELGAPRARFRAPEALEAPALDIALSRKGSRRGGDKRQVTRKARRKELKDLPRESRFRLELTTRRTRPGALARERPRFRRAPVHRKSGEEPGRRIKLSVGGRACPLRPRLKAVSAKGERGKTLVFDEVDAGIGAASPTRWGEAQGAACVHQVILRHHSRRSRASRRSLSN
jgi:hypothetical protein